MDLDILSILKLLPFYFPWVIILYLLLYPEKAQIWGSFILRLAAGLNRTFERKVVSSELEGRINEGCRRVNSEVPGLIPYKVKIEWITETTPQAIVEENMIIVKLKHHSSQAENLVHATTLFITKGLLPHAKKYLESLVAKSIDFTAIKKIFMLEKRDDALEIFYDQILNPEIDEIPELRDYCVIMEELDMKGLFTRILLREFLKMGNRLHPRMPTEDIKNETVKFVKFLRKIAMKPHREDINTRFRDKNIRIDTVLIGKPEVAAYGPDPYVQYVQKCFREGADLVYILAAGNYNIEMAKLVSDRLTSSSDIKKSDEDRYTAIFQDKRLPAICMMFVRSIPS